MGERQRWVNLTPTNLRASGERLDTLDIAARRTPWVTPGRMPEIFCFFPRAAPADTCDSAYVIDLGGTWWKLAGLDKLEAGLRIDGSDVSRVIECHRADERLGLN
jgi:hypothetical protein